MQVTSAKSSVKTPKKDWHHKIAKNRGKEWVKNIMAGRREAQLNPSVMRQIRLQKGIFQDKLASLVDLSESTYGAIERGRQFVKRERANQIAKRLGVTVPELFKQVSTKGKKDDHKFVAILIKNSLK